MEKIFYAHSVNVIGGAERVTLATINGIKENYQPVLLAPAGKDFADVAKTTGAIFEAIDASQPEKSKPFTFIKQFWQYYKIFKKHQPKLVHIGDLLALRSLQPICKFLNIPMVCHVHFPYETPFMHWALKGRYAPNHFIFCSQELKNHLNEELTALCPNSKMNVIHNGIDTEKFKPIKKNQNAIQRIGIIANLQYRKGHDDFLEMAKLLLDQGISAQFDIIGGDILQEPREPILKNKAKELGIAEHVIFHGQVSNVLEHLQQLDVVVCASHEEAFPISILEAMACGKAIVSTDVNGIPEAITNEKNGLLVPAHSPKALANAVQSLLNTPNITDSLGEQARLTVEANFSDQVFVNKTLAIYQQ